MTADEHDLDPGLTGEMGAGAERLYGALYGESSPEDVGLAAWHSVLTEPYWLNDALVVEGSIR